MLLVSEVEETEIFKICLEYWNHLAAELYRESPFSTSTSPLLSGNQHFDVPPRRQLYLPVLSKVIFQTIYYINGKKNKLDKCKLRILFMSATWTQVDDANLVKLLLNLNDSSL